MAAPGSQLQRVYRHHQAGQHPTFSFPPLSSSLIFSRASTVLFRSLCRRRPKSLNMVEPPERTTFCKTRRQRAELRARRFRRPPSKSAGGKAAAISGCAAVYLVQRAPDINGAVLDHLINDLRYGLSEVRVGKLQEIQERRGWMKAKDSPIGVPFYHL